MKPAPPNPLKERIAKHLRNADGFVREKRYHDALIEIDYALAVDPKNYYARSFKDRVKQLADQLDRQAFQETKVEEEKDDQKLVLISRLLQTADQFIETSDYAKALEQVAKVYKIDSQNYYAQAYSDRIEMLMEQGGTPQPAAAPTMQTDPQPEVASSLTVETPSEPAARILLYRKLLKEMWFDGKLDETEALELKKIRDLFGISEQDHEELEKQIHIDAYIEALTIAWRDGILSQNEKDVLEAMRRRFNITLEEHMSAEAKILWARNNEKGKAQILIADDDKTILLALAAKLKKHNYDILTAESVERALEILSLSTPAIILSDLMFEPGKLTGLEFYQQVRSNKRLEDVPFLLMSGVSDEFVVRAGMRMGVDSFFQKPFSLELLLATIEGKIQRKIEAGSK